MIQLFVDENEKPFNGWAGNYHPNQSLKTIGYLKDGMKQGIWFSWHSNGTLEKKKRNGKMIGMKEFFKLVIVMVKLRQLDKL